MGVECVEKNEYDGKNKNNKIILIIKENMYGVVWWLIFQGLVNLSFDDNKITIGTNVLSYVCLDKKIYKIAIIKIKQAKENSRRR